MGNGDRNSIIECGKKEVSHRRKMQPELPFPLRPIPNWQLLPVRNIADKMNTVNSMDFVSLKNAIFQDVILSTMLYKTIAYQPYALLFLPSSL